MKRGRVLVEPYKQHDGIYMLSDGTDNHLCTKNISNSSYETVYFVPNEDGTESEYRVWDPSKSDLAAALLKGGMDNIWIVPGAKVLYLGAQSFTTVTHISNIVGTSGLVYVITHSQELLDNLALEHPNVVPIFGYIEDPNTYRSSVEIGVDVVLSEVLMPCRHSLLALTASIFLKDGGHFVVSLQENFQKEFIEALIPKHLKGVIDSDFERPERELGIGLQFECLLQESLKPSHHACLKRGHYYFVGEYPVPPKPETWIDC